ncbi:hypothetical protein CEXT_377081 [Caerostris extrusa]|uniref:Uncharacterized protein n=1 Tax=Caerostris extrusa TaxID=172846 RepID=A0AAV4W1T4_CAEEX|nr:hypothetical protein CEXT_377081 [Caerostris extrusa]
MSRQITDESLLSMNDTYYHLLFVHISKEIEANIKRLENRMQHLSSPNSIFSFGPPPFSNLPSPLPDGELDRCQ